MLKKSSDFLGGTLMTVVGGIFLVISLALMLTDTPFPVDPAWVSVVICGIPLAYLAFWRVIFLKGVSKINSALLITIAMVAALAIGDIFAAGEVAFIMAVGAILEEKTTERARKGLRKLISLAPAQGRRSRARKGLFPGGGWLSPEEGGKGRTGKTGPRANQKPLPKEERPIHRRMSPRPAVMALRLRLDHLELVSPLVAGIHLRAQ